MSEEAIEGALRIGIGKFTIDEEIDQSAKILSNAIGEIRSLIFS